MTDLHTLLRETIEEAHQRAIDRSEADDENIRARVIHRGRRRRRVRVAGSLAIAIVIAVGGLASIDLFRRDTHGLDVVEPPRIVPVLVDEFPGPIAGRGSSLWIANSRTMGDPSGSREGHPDDEVASIARLDVDTGDVIDGPLAVTPNPFNVAIGESGLWLVVWRGDIGGGEGAKGSIERVDPTSLERTAIIARKDSAPHDVAVGVVEGREVVWVVDAARNELLGVDPASARVVETVPLEARPSAVRAGGGAVWVASASGGNVTRFDPADRSLVSFPIDDCATDVAVDGGSVWVTDFCSGDLYRLDLQGGKRIATIPLGEEPGDIHLAGGFVWVTTSRDVVRVDPATNAISGERIIVGKNPKGLASVGDTIFVSSDDGIFRLDHDRAD